MAHDVLFLSTLCQIWDQNAMRGNCGYKCADVDDPFPKQPLAADPDFLASLSKLDRGLDSDVGDDEGHGESPPASGTAPPAPFPVGALTPSARSGPRPLLDLFPPVPEYRGGTAPPIAATEPPHIARTRSHRSRSPAPASNAPLTCETFYGLNEKPFSLSSDPKFLYHSASHDRVADELVDAIRQREGVVVVTGEVGIGTTMLCRAVIEQLDRRTLTSLVSDQFAAVDDLLKTVLVDFGVISRDDLARGRLAQASRNDLSATLRDFLLSLAALQAFAVVIIDEAQDLPIDVLEHLQVLSDVGGSQRLLQVVLVGQPSLLALLRRPELRQLDRQISRRLELGPLAEDEIPGYVMHRLTVAGGNVRVEFEDEAIARVYKLSGGVPRVVNLLCDRALTVAYGSSASVIDENTIDSAADDLPRTESKASRTARAALATFALALLMLIGAAAAAWVFGAQLSRVVVQWEGVPQPRPAPALPVPPPIASPAAPADADIR